MLGFEKDSQQENSYLHHRSSDPTAPLSPSCFHAFISYIYLFLWGPTPKAFWYTNLLEILIWSLTARIDHVSQCTSSQHKMPDKFTSVMHFNTERGLGNSLVLLLSEYIAATHNKHAWEIGKPKNVEITARLGMRKVALKSICATFSPVTPLFLLISEKLMSSATRKYNLFKILSDKFWISWVFFTDLPITEIAILSALRRFEGCLEVEGWLKTGNKGRLFQAWLSQKALPTFLPVLLIRDKAECHLIKDVTMRKFLISPAKMTQLSLSIVQHLARWPPFFISFLQSACLREDLYKIWEKSIWYFYHARATLSLLLCRTPKQAVFQPSVGSKNAFKAWSVCNENRWDDFCFFLYFFFFAKQLFVPVQH